MRKAGVVLAVLLIGAVAQAGPGTMSFQGSLTDGGGTPIPDDTYDMRFTVYSEEVGGASAWTETLNAVEVQNGLYSVVLGETTTLHPSIFANDYSLWLEVEIDVAGDGFDADDVYSPRQPITAAGWAMDAERLNGRGVNDFQMRVTGSAPAERIVTTLRASAPAE